MLECILYKTGNARWNLISKNFHVINISETDQILIRINFIETWIYENIVLDGYRTDDS